MKPKKLIRERIQEKLQPGEFERIEDKAELNVLYALKVKEELTEIQNAFHTDVMEFVDLMDVVIAFAGVNGFDLEELIRRSNEKMEKKGSFSNLALNNLNPHNPSNLLYFNPSVFKL
jgi:predicted house-cleaning noncanonical NTP pyrophosphatase (MazG superfamily)